MPNCSAIRRRHSAWAAKQDNSRPKPKLPVEPAKPEPEMPPEPEKPEAPTFYPVEENQPFPAVERLDTARLAEQDREVGIVIDE